MKKAPSPLRQRPLLVLLILCLSTGLFAVGGLLVLSHHIVFPKLVCLVLILAIYPAVCYFFARMLRHSLQAAKAAFRGGRYVGPLLDVLISLALTAFFVLIPAIGLLRVLIHGLW